jgi:heptosyltransferase III
VKRTILILHPGALGDILLAVPALRALRRRFPQHETVLVASAAVSRLLRECGLIEHWIPWEGQVCLGLFSGPSCLPKELQSWLSRCDLVVAWMEDKDGALGFLFRSLGVARIRIRSPFSPGLRAKHQSDRFLETLNETAGRIASEASLRVSPHLLRRGQDCLDDLSISLEQSLVLVHPGSGSIHKCIEPKRMACLIEGLRQKGMCPVVLEGPADREVVDQIRHLVTQPPLVLRERDLTRLAGVLEQVTAYIGHDSGVTHLAALLGVRTIALFGPTDPHRWAPRGRQVTILRGDPCTCESWEAVKKCVDKPCLQVTPDEILVKLGGKVSSANPRNST